MPPLPTITDVYRVTLLWSLVSGVRPVNVFHVRKASSTASDVADDVEAAIVAGFTPQNMFRPMGSGYTLESFEVLPLDGTSTTFQRNMLPHGITGGSSGEIIPQAAGVISLKTDQRGARGRGRMYLGPTTEGSDDAGILNSAIASATLTGWGNFIASLTAAACPLVIASYLHVDAHDVVNVRVDSVVGTQRRRANQLR
jgi:hypothetical protein